MNVRFDSFLLLLGAIWLLALLPTNEMWGQVRSNMQEDQNHFVLTKAVPKGPDSLMLFQDGTPQAFYVIQLARFERMEDIPKLFPKGTTLWLNPDHGAEAILMSSQFYASFEEAQRVALQLREEGFPSAFARSKPFFVRYR